MSDLGRQCALELNSRREPVAGSVEMLAAAIRNAAQLHIYTEFIYNEHIDVTSGNDELVREVAEFGITYLLNDSWTAGIMSLRQPVDLPLGFGPRPSMSFFMYNQNAQQAIARPYLDGIPATGRPGPSAPKALPEMLKYRMLDRWDSDTNAPSHNFVYEFETYRFCVNDAWQEVYSHDDAGNPVSGSLDDLVDAFSQGCELKVGIRNLCSDLAKAGSDAPDHEVFVQAGSGYYGTDSRVFSTGTHPVVRVRPAIPMRYESGNWDFGWLMLCTDGQTVYRRCDPYTLEFQDVPGRHAIRWFVRSESFRPGTSR